MSYLRSNETHIDRILSNFAQNYVQDATQFISTQFAPVNKVSNQSNLYKVHNQADLFRIEEDLRSPGTEANKIITSTGSDTYFCKNYALKDALTVEDMENADKDSWASLEQDTVMGIQDKLLLNRENRLLTTLQDTTQVGTSSAVASAWSDPNNSDPFGDVNTMMDNEQDSTGFAVNKLVFGLDSWRDISRNDTIINKVNKTGVIGGGGNATERQVAELFGVEKVLVARTFKNTAASPFPLANTQMMKDFVHLSSTLSTPSKMRPTYFSYFRWTGGQLANMSVRKHKYDTKLQSQEYETGFYEDQKVVGIEFGALIINTSSST